MAMMSLLARSEMISPVVKSSEWLQPDSEPGGADTERAGGVTSRSSVQISAEEGPWPKQSESSEAGSFQPHSRMCLGELVTAELRSEKVQGQLGGGSGNCPGWAVVSGGPVEPAPGPWGDGMLQGVCGNISYMESGSLAWRR